MQNNKNKETLEIYVLGDDFKYYENLKYLPLTSYPSNIQSALIVYSLRGTAKISVHEDVHWIQPDELIILLPGQFVSFSEPSEDFFNCHNGNIFLYVRRCPKWCTALFSAFLFLYAEPLLLSSE